MSTLELGILLSILAMRLEASAIEKAGETIDGAAALRRLADRLESERPGE